VRDDIKQTNTAVVFLLLLSILLRYYQCSTLPLHTMIFCDVTCYRYYRLRIKKSDIISRGLPLTGIGYTWRNLNRWPNSSENHILHFDSCIWHPRPLTMLLELLVCAVHPITNFHRIFYIALDPFPEGVFRLESAMVVVMFLRVYLIGIYLRDLHATSIRRHKDRYAL
jgi:hypothetical protein